MVLASNYLTAIKGFEGFTPVAKWDYAQHTNGYGTKALYPGERISKAEAEARFQAEIAHAAALVQNFAPELNDGTKAALTSLTFNAGTRWMHAGLGQAVRDGDLEAIREIFVQYNKAGGEILPGLVRRREHEVQWIGGHDGASSQSVADVGTQGQAALELVSAASTHRTETTNAASAIPETRLETPEIPRNEASPAIEAAAAGEAAGWRAWQPEFTTLQLLLLDLLRNENRQDEDT